MHWRCWVLLFMCAVGVRAQEAKMRLQLGHAAPITSIAFSLDQRYILTGSEDKTAQLWDVKTRRVIRGFDHPSVVTSVAFSAEARYVLTGCKDGTARLWETNTGQELGRLQGHTGGVTAVAFSSDGRRMVTGGEDGTARIWDSGSKRELHRLAAATKSVRAVAFSPKNADWVLTAGETNVQLWDAGTGRSLRTFKGHTDVVKSAVFASDGKSVVTGSEDKTVRLWDASTAQEVRRFDNHSNYVDSVASSPDGRSVLAAGLGGWWGLWDAATGMELHFREPDLNGISTTLVTFSPDSRYALIGVASSVVLRELSSGTESGFAGATVRPNTIAFMPDGKSALTGNADGTVRSWDFDTGGTRLQFKPEKGSVETIAVSPDGRYVMTGSLNGFAKMWEVASGDSRSYYDSGPVYAVKFSLDGRYGLSATLQETWLWDVAAGTRLGPFEGGGYNGSVAFTANGRQLVNQFSGPPNFVDTIRVWDVATRKELHRAEATILEMSPDGRYALRLTANATQLLEFDTLKEACHFDGPVTPAAFSRDGRTMLTGSILREVPSCRQIRTLAGRSVTANAAAFALDGRHLLTAESDGTLTLWDPGTGQWLARLLAFPDGSWAVVDPAGHYDATDPDRSPGLYFISGNDVIEIGQMKQRFYTPGLLRRVWRGASEGIH